MPLNSSHTLHLILGNQLFPPGMLELSPGTTCFMAEDVGLCTYVRHHKKKLILFLAAMRSYADDLRRRGISLIEHRLDEDEADLTYEEKLEQALFDHQIEKIITWEIEDKPFEQRIHDFASQRGIELETRASPMFLTTRTQFAEYLDSADAPFMADFYRLQRRRLNILTDDEGKPVGGKWSFDADNRKKLPDHIEIPGRPRSPQTRHVAEVRTLVEERFANHPGISDNFGYPTTRHQAREALDHFLRHRFHLFGDYEDALSQRDDYLFHSVLTPALNLGLITPREVVDRALHVAQEQDIPLNALEGFIRQIIGWREFIRGIYRHFSDQQEQANFFNHQRQLTGHWYAANTGIPPLDDAIRKASRLGYCHHIERLMVLANIMNLAQIHPGEAHRWFMEMFVDSSEWVMGPNVYGMGLYADGGIFSTKPYICGSNYILKMSDYESGPWCDVLDGLYWSFIDRHRDFFENNPRLSMMPRSLDKLDPARRQRIFEAAQRFINRCTRKQPATAQ